MPILFASLLHGHFQVHTTRAQPGIDKPDETIDGFPTYSVTIDTLERSNPQAKEKLRQLARKIIASHKGSSTRIIGFEVHGHADYDLNSRFNGKPIERERFEKEVSEDRAEHAMEVLLELIKAEGGQPILAGIEANSSARGFGSSFRVAKPPPALSEFQMKRNRRVEIFLRTFQFKPAPPSPKPPPKPPQPGMNWRIQIKSGNLTSISAGFPGVPPPIDHLGGVNILMHIELTDLDRKQKAGFTAISQGVVMPGTQVGPPPFPIQTVFVRKGPTVDFTTTSSVTLQKFVGSVKVGQNETLAAVASAGGAFFFDFDDAIIPAVTHPTPVVVKGDTGVTVQPTANLGIVPVRGSMTIDGSPVTVP